MKLLEPYNPLRHVSPEKAYQISAPALNTRTFLDYYYRLQELAINMFEWINLPDTVSERFIELTLCEYGYALYFNDEIMGNLALTCNYGGPLDVYRIPVNRRAYSAGNGYQKECTNKDSVLIFNNYLHTPTINTILLYSRRLYEIERAIDVNVKGQKTPIVILCDESQKFTLKNVYAKYDGNEPVIYGTKNLDLQNIQVLNTAAPYVSDKLNILKRQIWNEALTFFGIENANSEKKERLISDEVESNLGGVQAQRFIMLNSRKEACRKINKMFGTNIDVRFRQQLNVGGDDDGILYNRAENAD